ncbi:MAG: hypothetical protein WBA66_02810 [Xanthobacteraceae bacterium]
MPDVAVLGIAVDSSEAERNLRNFEAVARRTGESTEQVAARFQKAREVAKSLPNPLKNVSDGAARAGNQFQQMALGSKAAEVAFKGFSRIFSGVVSSLAAGGIAGITAAITSYALEAFNAVDDLDEKIKQHTNLVRSIKTAYGEAGKGINISVNESIAVLKTLLNFKTDDIKKEFQSLSKSIAESLSDYRITGLGPAVEENSRKFAAFGDAITAFKSTLNDGTPDILAFRRAVQQIIDSSADEKTRKLGRELLEMTAKASGAQLAIESAAKAVRSFGADALMAASQGEAFAKAMSTLGKTVSPNLSDRERILANYSDALTKATGTEERLAVERVKNDQLAILSANERKRALEEAARAAEAAAKRYQGTINAANNHIATLGAETTAAGQGVSNLAALREKAAKAAPVNDNREARDPQSAKAA